MLPWCGETSPFIGQCRCLCTVIFVENTTLISVLLQGPCRIEGELASRGRARGCALGPGLALSGHRDRWWFLAATFLLWKWGVRVVLLIVGAIHVKRPACW